MKSILLVLFLSISLISPAQEMHWVYFSDKGPEAELPSFSQVLSEQSLERRAKQGIAPDFTDLPVFQPYLSSLRDAELEIIAHSKWFNAALVKGSSTQVQNFQALPFVKKVVARKNYSTQMASIEDARPMAPLALESASSASSIPYGPSFGQAVMLRTTYLHQEGYLGEGMNIAVFDAGFSAMDLMAAFDTLFNDGRVKDTRDFVDGDKTVYHGSSHGTYVISTMTAYLPNKVVGTAPKANYYLCRTEDVSSETLAEEYNWLMAAEYADSIGVDIINSSLGYTTMDDSTQSHTYQDMDGNTTIITKAADMAAAKGILVENSAGNSGTSSWFHIGAPADGDSVCAVGAVNKNAVYVPFSSKGPSSDGRVKPNLAAMGQDVVFATFDGGYSDNGSGTSFAAPILAGSAACFWQSRPWMSNMELLDVMQQSAHQANNPDSLLGYGIPDLANASILNTTELEMPLINVYPNPVEDRLHINHRESKVEAIQMFNILGAIENVQIERSENESSINMSMLPAGIYFLKLKVDGKVITEKIIK